PIGQSGFAEPLQIANRVFGSGQDDAVETAVNGTTDPFGEWPQEAKIGEVGNVRKPDDRQAQAIAVRRVRILQADTILRVELDLLRHRKDAQARPCRARLQYLDARFEQARVAAEAIH